MCLASRLIELEDGKKFILIDTVGFVSKLPHALVNAFKATLEELIDADLLIHVVDASFENHDFQIEVTEKVLSEIGAGAQLVIKAYNKIDLVPGFVPLGLDSVALSAKSGKGWENLIEKIKDVLFADFRSVELLVPYTRGDIVSYINEKTHPTETRYEAEGTYIKAELGESDRNRLKEFICSDM